MKHGLVHQHIKGLTLIELIVVLAIIGISLSMALPNLQEWHRKHQSWANARRLAQFVQMARELAVTSSQHVTICPTVNNIDCSSDWSKGYMFFSDSNKNGYIDAGEVLTQVAAPIPEQASLKWRAFANIHRIIFTPQGYTLSFNGTFTYCGKANDPKTAHLLILNKPGRLRFGKDENGDGIPEKPSGDPAEC